jgi:hypothetical protein
MALALALVAAAIWGQVPGGVVVFAAWSLAEDWVRVWTRRRQDGSRVLTPNRGRETASLPGRDAHGGALKRPGPHLAVADRVPLLPATGSRPVTRGAQTSGGFTLGVRLPGLGQVRSVVSCAHAALKGRAVVLVTNRVDGSAGKSSRLSAHRWPTAPCDQDRTGLLGGHASRRRSAEAMGRHGGLAFVASSLWHLTCRPAGPERTQGLIHTMGDACRPQGRALIQQLWEFVHDHWFRGATADQVFVQVLAKQRGIVLV